MIDNATFRKGIREDGTVEGYAVETHYLPCKAIGDDDGFLRVVIDDNATDVETRVPHSALIAAGWVKATAGVLSADDSKGEGTTHVIGSDLLRELADALAARCGTNAEEWPLIERARKCLDGVAPNEQPRKEGEQP